MRNSASLRLALGLLLVSSLAGCATKTEPQAAPKPGLSAPNPTPVQGSTQPAPAPTAPTAPGTKEVARGSLGITGMVDWFAASGNAIAIAQGATATLFQFDGQGKATKLAVVSPPENGPVGAVAVGDLENNGQVRMAVAYENALYVTDQDGKAERTAVKGLYNVVMGDLDGDSKTELLLTLLQNYQLQRRTGSKLEVLAEVRGEEPIRYGATNQRLTRDYDVTALKENGKSLLIGHRTTEDGQIFALLYEWTEKGPRMVREVPVSSPKEAPLFEMTAGQAGGRPVLVLSHGGEKPYLDVVSAEDGKRVAKFDLPGPGDHTVRMGAFVPGAGDQVIAIDERGGYVIYSVQ